MDTVSVEKRSEIMSKVKSFGSKMEIRLKTMFADLGVRFVYQPKMSGKPDFFLPAFSAAVFADSCFWHGCPEHYKEPKSNVRFWRAKIGRNGERDAETTATLRAQNFGVVRIWEHDLKTMEPPDLLGLLKAAKNVGDQTQITTIRG